MRRDYATGLSKQYLEYLGITSVSEDGKEIYKNGKLVKIHNDGNYNIINFYDPILRESIPKEIRTNSSGQFVIGVHRVVYTWFNGFIPNGLVVDHINGDKTDNNKDNLQLLTPQQNLFKSRKTEKKVYPLPKKKIITLEKCEQLLEECVANYEQAKRDKDVVLAKKYRTYKVRYESWLEQLKVRSVE